MPARLILNADDFGLTRGINRAVAELHRTGVLTSATLMANGAAFDDAVAVAESQPTLGVGCHIVLVDGMPVSPPDQIPTLLGPDRRTFRTSLLHFVRDLLLGRIDQEEIAREALAQVQRLQRAGINVTHLDTHKHTHIFPQVARPLISLGTSTSIATMRYPFEPGFSRRLSSPGVERRLQIGLLEHFHPAFNRLTVNVLTTGGTLGIAATGTLTEQTLTDLLSNLPAEGTYELCCHPGFHDADLDHANSRLRASREIERQALLSVVPKMLSLPYPPQLIHYGDLHKQT